MTDNNLLHTEVEQLLGFSLSDEQLNAYVLYASEMAEWNRKFNLTAIRSPEDVRRKHFLDSLSCVLAMRDKPIGRVIDIGTGAGFPGLPLKILFPDMYLTLVESIAKKTGFLSHIVKELNLSSVEVITSRAEKVGQDPAHREKYDWAVARAVARLPILAEYLLPLVRVGGFTLAQKGEGVEREAEEAERAIEILGGRLEQLIPVEIPGVGEQRYLVVIEKIDLTPEKYPRREGIPGKRPIS